MTSDARWRWLLGAGTALVVALAVVPSGPVDDVTYLAIGVAACAVLVTAVVRRPLVRAAGWRWLAVALVLVLAGDAVWVVFSRRGIDPYPSIADVLYLASYPIQAHALWLLGRRDRRDHGTLVDSAIIGVAAAVLTWMYWAAPYAQDPSLTSLERLVSVAYPIGDLLLVPLIVRLVLVHGARHASHLMLLLGVLCYFVADVLFGVGALEGWYVEGGPIDGLWLLAYVLFAVAAWHPAAARATPEPPADLSLSGRRLAALAAASTLAPTVLLLQETPDRSAIRVVASGSIVLFLLVVQRMAGLIRHIRDQADELAHLSRTDPLTGAHNRRALDETLAVLVSVVERHDHHAAVAMLDLDHFKRFNDRHGHPAGDAFLRDTVAAWQAELRASDILARYGGEEFVVVMPYTDASEAVEVAERLRAVAPGGETVSIGVVVWEPGMTPGELIDAADRGVYAAKHQGRDRTVLTGVDTATSGT